MLLKSRYVIRFPSPPSFRSFLFKKSAFSFSSNINDQSINKKAHPSLITHTCKISCTTWIVVYMFLKGFPWYTFCIFSFFFLRFLPNRHNKNLSLFFSILRQLSWRQKTTDTPLDVWQAKIATEDSFVQGFLYWGMRVLVNEVVGGILQRPTGN